MAQHTEPKPTRQRRRKAREAWMLFLRRLRNTCQRIEKVADWYQIVGEAQDLLDEYADVVPAGTQRRIRQALKLSDATLAGAEQACGVLQTEVEAVIKLLGAGSIVTTVGVISLIAVAVLAAAITVAANVTAVNVHIINQGCQPVELNRLPLPSTLLGLAGVRLPAAPIEDGQMGVATLPPITVHVDARDPATAALKVIGIVLPRANLSTIDEISFDGRPVLGRQASFDLGGSKEHELLIACYH